MSEITRAFESSASLMRVHGILSIIFGGIGAIVGIFFTALFAIAMAVTNNESDQIAYLVFAILALVVWLIPHIYLVIAGIVLVKQPEPGLAKVLTIINLVIGVFWNYVLLVFAIISLVQLGDYKHGYHHKKAH